MTIDEELTLTRLIADTLEPAEKRRVNFKTKGQLRDALITRDITAASYLPAEIFGIIDKHFKGYGGIVVIAGFKCSGYYLHIKQPKIINEFTQQLLNLQQRKATA